MLSTIKSAVEFHRKDMFDEEIDLNTGQIANISRYELPTIHTYSEDLLRLENAKTYPVLNLVTNSLLQNFPESAQLELRNAFRIPVDVPITDQLSYFLSDNPIYLNLTELSDSRLITDLLHEPKLAQLELNSSLLLKCKNATTSAFISFVRFLASFYEKLSVYRSIYESLLDDVIYICFRNLQRTIVIPQVLIQFNRFPDNYIYLDDAYRQFVHNTFVVHEAVTIDAFNRVQLISNELDPKLDKLEAIRQFFQTTQNMQLKPLETRMSLPYLFAYVNGPCKYSILQEVVPYFGAYIGKITSTLLQEIDYPYLRYFVTRENVRIHGVEKLLNLSSHKKLSEAIVEKKLYEPKPVTKYLNVFAEELFIDAKWTSGKKSVNPRLVWTEKRPSLLNDTKYSEIARKISVSVLAFVPIEILARVFAYLNVTSVLDCNYHFGEGMLASIPKVTNIKTYTGVINTDDIYIAQNSVTELKSFLDKRFINISLIETLPATTNAKCVYLYIPPEEEKKFDQEYFERVLKLVKGNTYLVLVSSKMPNTPGFTKSFEVLISSSGSKISVYTRNRITKPKFANYEVLSYGLDLADIAAKFLLKPNMKYVVGYAKDPVYNCVLLRMLQRKEKIFAFTIGELSQLSHTVHTYLHRHNITLKFYPDLESAQAACDKANLLRDIQVDLSDEAIRSAYGNLDWNSMRNAFGNRRLILSNANPILTDMIVNSNIWSVHVIDVNVRPNTIANVSTYAKQFLSDLIFLTYLKEIPNSGNDLAVLF